MTFFILEGPCKKKKKESTRRDSNPEPSGSNQRDFDPNRSLTRYHCDTSALHLLGKGKNGHYGPFTCCFTPPVSEPS